MPKYSNFLKTILLAAAGSLLITASSPNLMAAPVTFRDDLGQPVTFTEPPRRLISLVPAVTEIIFALGEGGRVAAVTHADTWPPEATRKPVVGGFFNPDAETVAAFQPDTIFISDLHSSIIDRFKGTGVRLVCLDTRSVQNSFDNIERLGAIFQRQCAADALVAGIKEELALIAKKVDKTPTGERLRVIRLMGRDRVMTPGDDSFQNEIIRAAGGIPPQLGKNGDVVEVSLEEWRAFDPQLIYGCGGDKSAARVLFDRPGWREVAAVKTGRIFYFPCNLTCRAATGTGTFIGWLAARIYSDAFANPQNQVLADGIFKSRPVVIDLPYVRRAQIVSSRIHDFFNKTLLIDLDQPQVIVSTLEGQRNGIRTIGNHYASPPGWAVAHKAPLDELRAGIFSALKIPPESTALLMTGADMDNLAIKKASFRDLTVYALVTAGVSSNALRMSRDTGGYYEPGTINVIILPNRRLSERAMTRAIISATEGKTAALLDMDIRSSYQPAKYRATGTGTDNIIVAAGAGDGRGLENAGGHSKLGELVARAVYNSVREAVFQQNGLSAERNIFQRLKERHITPYGLVAATDCDCGLTQSQFAGALERALLDPQYSAFMETALALSDDYEKGLLKDLSLYMQWCKDTAEQIAGKQIPVMREFSETSKFPTVLKLALNALLNGVYNQDTVAAKG